MARVAVITDSVCSLPKELIDQYAIKIVPISIIIDGSIYHDGINITPTEVYDFIASGKNSATTSSPTPNQFLQAYEELSKWADGILCMTICSDISMMYDSAIQAKQLAEDLIPHVEINVFDSRTAGGAQGFITLAAARAAMAGANLAQVTDVAKRMMPRVNMIGVLDTLQYLAKAGRIPKIAAWGGSLLKINPILSFGQDEIGLLEKARTKPKAVKRLLEIMEERSQGKPVHVILMHANAPHEVEALKQQITSTFNCVEIYTSDFSPTMGIHTGPGVLAIAFYCDESEEIENVG